MPVGRFIRAFIKMEAAGGLLLMAAAAAALFVVNSPAAPLYERLLDFELGVSAGSAAIEKPLILWINDGLMAIFFLLVGLEIKREVTSGELSSLSNAALPIAAAVGGMAIPALVFVAVNAGSPETMRGWAIPAATDIAFALGILSLLGSRAPVALKIFLTALAIIDDLGAILIIAVFYTSKLSLPMLGFAGICLLALVALNRARVTVFAAYLLVGAAMWVFVLKSGVHATLAGVVLAMAIPINGRSEGEHSPLEILEHALHPWVAFAIMPIFAFANAGVPLSGLGLDALLQPLPLGIVLGLFVGKQIGVFAFARLAVAAGMARLPEGTGWRHVYGASLLAGVGFTMSLFIGSLAFEDEATRSAVRIGVIVGSVLSGIVGYAVLLGASPRRDQGA